MPLELKAQEAAHNYNMINKGDTVAVCLSGGADSMALFHFLCCNKEKYDIKIIALHINHGLRKESDAEQKLVAEFCKQHNTECFVFSAQMNDKEKPQGMSVEMWAREIRYDYFAKMSQQYSAKLATAHTLSDKCETVLFNITRGSGLKGACGIPAKRDNIIRPLIYCTRFDIESYCSDNNIPYVTDLTNFEDIYSRNKIRLNVIPQLKQINQNAENAIGEFAKESEDIYTYLTQLSDILYKNSISLKGFDISEIKKNDTVIIKNFLRNLLDRYNCLSKENVTAIFDGIYLGTFQRRLSKDIFCEISDGFLYFYKPKEEKIDKTVKQIDVEFDKSVIFLSKKYKIRKISMQEFEKIKKNDKNYLTYCFDYDTIDDKLVLRTRKQKDEITLLKRNVTKTLKKLFIEDKLPIDIRQNLPILSNKNGDVIWLENYGVNKQFSITPKTKSIFIIEKE